MDEIPTAEQVEQFIQWAEDEAGPECEAEWFTWIAETIRAAADQARQQRDAGGEPD